MARKTDIVKADRLKKKHADAGRKGGDDQRRADSIQEVRTKKGSLQNGRIPELSVVLERSRKNDRRTTYQGSKSQEHSRVENGTSGALGSNKRSWNRGKGTGMPRKAGGGLGCGCASKSS